MDGMRRSWELHPESWTIGQGGEDIEWVVFTKLYRPAHGGRVSLVFPVSSYRITSYPAWGIRGFIDSGGIIGRHLSGLRSFKRRSLSRDHVRGWSLADGRRTRKWGAGMAGMGSAAIASVIRNGAGPW